MQITVEIGWILAVALVAIRFAAAVALTPVFGAADIPARLRVIFILALAALVVSATGIEAARLPTSLPAFLGAALVEVILGAALAFGVFTAFAVFLLAGRVMDIQLGFGVAVLIDPTNRTQSPLLGTFLNLMAVALFFAIDGHHLLLRGLVFSLEQAPPGASLADIDPAAIVAQFGGMFAYALALAAPVLITILLIDVGLAIVARTMPQVNIFIVSLPLKIFVGLLVLAVSLRYMGPLVARIFEDIFDYWHRLLS
jgi:flagellar biosynthetic protein FliR